MWMNLWMKNGNETLPLRWMFILIFKRTYRVNSRTLRTFSPIYLRTFFEYSFFNIIKYRKAITVKFTLKTNLNASWVSRESVKPRWLKLLRHWRNIRALFFKLTKFTYLAIATGSPISIRNRNNFLLFLNHHFYDDFLYSSVFHRNYSSCPLCMFKNWFSRLFKLRGIYDSVIYMFMSLI